MKHVEDKVRVLPNDSDSKTRNTLSRASGPLFLEDFRSRLSETQKKKEIVKREHLGNTKNNCIVTINRFQPDQG